VLQETIREGLRRRRDHDLLAAAEERYQERRATKAYKWKNNRLLRKVTVLTLNKSCFVRIHIVNAFSLSPFRRDWKGLHGMPMIIGG